MVDTVAGITIPATAERPGTVEADNTLRVEEVDKWDKQFQALSLKLDTLVSSQSETTVVQKTLTDRLAKYLDEADKAKTDQEAQKALQAAQKTADDLKATQTNSSTSQTSQNNRNEGEGDRQDQGTKQQRQGRQERKARNGWL